MRQPGPCVRALCEAVAVLLSKNMTCARPRRNATPSEHFPHTSQCTPHTLHFALRTCTSHSTLHLTPNHVSSSHLISSHFVPSLLTCHLSKFYSTVFISSEHWSTFLISSKLFSTHLSCSARQKALTVSTEAWDTDAFTLYTGKASRKYLCTTKLSSSPQVFCIPKEFC